MRLRKMLAPVVVLALALAIFILGFGHRTLSGTDEPQRVRTATGASLPADLADLYGVALPNDAADVAYTQAEALQGGTLYVRFTTGVDNWRSMLGPLGIPSTSLVAGDAFSPSDLRASQWSAQELARSEFFGCTEAENLKVDAVTSCIAVSAANGGRVTVHLSASRG